MIAAWCGVAVGCERESTPTGGEGGAAPETGEVEAGASDGAVTFNRDVAPIIYQHCTTCHREGQSAPFTFLSYRDVYKRRNQIRQVIRSGFMPPWQPEAGDLAFVGDRRMTAAEIETVHGWVQAGGPEGSAADRRAAPTFESAWALGEPDLVVRFPRTFMLQADGTDVFRFFRVDLPIKQRRYVAAFDFRPDNPAVVHHVVMQPSGSDRVQLLGPVQPSGATERMPITAVDTADGFMTGWVPGRKPLPPVKGLSWPVDPGSSLEVQLHMLPSGKVEPVQMSIALYFADEPPTMFPMKLRLGSQEQDIPAGATDEKIEDWFQLPVDVELLAIMPHAHYLGKEIRADAKLPDNRRIELLHIVHWDFNWQEEYRFVEPIALPAGTTLHVSITYDNSEDNTRNPNQPPQRVLFGPNSSDEMGDVWFQVVPRNAQDAAVLKGQYAAKDLAAWVRGWQKRVQVAPDDYETRNRLAIHYATRGKLHLAIEQWREVVRALPGSIGPRVKLARALAQVDEHAEALVHYEHLVAQRPGHAGWHFEMGLAQMGLGEAEQAAEQFGAALAIDEGMTDARLYLASMLTAQDRHGEATVHLERVISERPNAATAYDMLANIFLLDNRPETYDPKRAVALAVKACELTGLRDFLKLRTLAAACMAAGDAATAERMLGGAQESARERWDEDLADRIVDLIERAVPKRDGEALLN